MGPRGPWHGPLCGSGLVGRGVRVLLALLHLGFFLPCDFACDFPTPLYSYNLYTGDYKTTPGTPEGGVREGAYLPSSVNRPWVGLRYPDNAAGRSRRRHRQHRRTQPTAKGAAEVLHDRAGGGRDDRG